MADICEDCGGNLGPDHECDRATLIARLHLERQRNRELAQGRQAVERFRDEVREKGGNSELNLTYQNALQAALYLLDGYMFDAETGEPLPPDPKPVAPKTAMAPNPVWFYQAQQVGRNVWANRYVVLAVAYEKVRGELEIARLALAKRETEPVTYTRT